MRPLEIALLLGLLPALWLPATTRERWRLIVTPIVVGVAGAHLVVEGGRWQMVPAYGLTFTLAVVRAAQWCVAGPLFRTLTRRMRWWIRALGRGLGLTAIGLSATCALLLPIFHLPVPSGPHDVGTTTLALVDSARAERFTSDPDDRREIVVRAWYPAQNTNRTPRERYAEHAAIGQTLAEYLDLPRFVFNHLSLVRMHAHLTAPVETADAPYPVVLFSHGYGLGFAEQNTAQMEDLASHGYVVLGISHPYEALATVYPDGRTVTFDIDRIQHAYGEGLEQLYRQFKRSEDLSQRRSLFRRMRSIIATESIEVWTRDIRFVMDRLSHLSRPSSPLSNSVLDLQQIGLFGMSFGGAAAVHACQEDRRCDASLNLDGLQGPDRSSLYVPESRGSVAPTFFMYSESHDGRNAPVYDDLPGRVYTLTVRDSRHYNFSDFSIMSPLFRLLNVVGPIRGPRMIHILNTYTRTFFDTALKGSSAQPLSPARLPNGPNVQFDIRQSSHSD